MCVSELIKEKKMVGMIVTDGQMGVSSFQGNVGFSSNCCSNSISSSGLTLHRRPNFAFGLTVNGKLKRGRFLRAVSLKGEPDGKSVGGAIVEKEFEFKPSFNEYLKVMESVKIVRDKKQDSTGSDKHKSLDSARETLLANGNEKEVKLSVSQENFEKEKKLRAVKKDDSFKRGDDFIKQESKEKSVVKMNGRFGVKQRSSAGTAKWFQGKDITDRKKSEYRVEEGEEVNIDAYRGYERKARSSKIYEKKGTDYSSWDYRSMNKVMGTQRIDVGSKKFREGHERSRAQNSNAIEKNDIMPKHGKPNRRAAAFFKRGDEKSLNVERDAFRYLGEENSGLMHERCRSRVEMDERIQKLAKSLNGADVDIPEWMFAKMMRSAQIIFTDHSISRVIQILGKYGNWRRVLQVIEWLQIRERYKSHKLRYVYTTALYVLGKAKRPVEALNVFNAMLQQISSYPDLVAYHSIAVTLGQAGHMRELFDVIDIMRSPPKKKFKTGALGEWDPRLEPDIIVYNAVLNACVQRKQWEGAFWVLQQLKEKGLNPTVTTYGLVMEVMFACGKYNLVHDFFNKVQKSAIPNALTYRVLLNTLWKEGKLDEASRTVQEMEIRGVVGSAALYYDYARCLCSVGRSRDALMQIEKICKVASKPLVVTYTGLIQACLDSGNIKDGTYIFSHMKEFCSPNLVTCNIMLKGYMKHGMFEEGKELFQDMLEDASRSKNRDEKRLLAAPDIYTYNTFFDACVNEKRWDEFEFAYKKMLDHGFHFNSKRHLQLILDASRAGKGELLDITWNHLVEMDRSPPPSLVKERFCAKLEKQDYECALSCICDQSLARLPEFSKKAWLKLLGENSVKFQRGTLDQLVHEITNVISRTDQPNILLYNLLVSCKELSRAFEMILVEPTEPFPTLQTVPELKL